MNVVILMYFDGRAATCGPLSEERQLLECLDIVRTALVNRLQMLIRQRHQRYSFIKTLNRRLSLRVLIERKECVIKLLWIILSHRILKVLVVMI